MSKYFLFIYISCIYQLYGPFYVFIAQKKIVIINEQDNKVLSELPLDAFSLQVKTQNKAKTKTSSPRQKGREGLLKETNKSKPPVTVRAPNASASLLLLPLFLIGLRTCSTDLLRRGEKLRWSGPEQTQRNSGTESFVVCAQVWVYRHIKAAAQPPGIKSAVLVLREKWAQKHNRVQQRASLLWRFHHINVSKYKVK